MVTFGMTEACKYYITDRKWNLYEISDIWKHLSGVKLLNEPWMGERNQYLLQHFMNHG